MDDDAPAGQRPDSEKQTRVVAAFLLGAGFLDDLITRIMRAPGFPGRFTGRYPTPLLGVMAVDLTFDVVGIRSRFTPRRRSRLGVDLRLSGRVVWSVPLSPVTQTLDVRLTLYVKPQVRQGDGIVEIGTDFARADVDDVRVEVTDTSYLPGSMQSELLGPVGRRLVDRLTAEVVARSVRGMRERWASFGGPLPEWLALVGAENGATVRLRDRAVAVLFHGGAAPGEAPEQAPIDVPAGAEGSLHVTIDSRHMRPLLVSWLDAMARSLPEIAIQDVRFGFGDGWFDVHASLRWRFATLRADIRVRPRLEGGVLRFVPESIDLDSRGGRAANLVMPVRTAVERWVAGRMNVVPLWHLPVPMCGSDHWLLSVEGVEIRPDRIEVSCESWFAPFR